MSKDYENILSNILSDKYKKFCKKELRRTLMDIEKERKKYFLICNTLYAIGSLSILFFIWSISTENYSFFLNEFLNKLYVLTWIIPFVAGIILYCNFKQKIKKLILPKLFSFVGNFTLSEDKIFIQRYIESLKLFNSFNRFSCDDRFEGIYNSLKIDISEILLQKVTGSGKRRRVVTIFRGIFVKVPCNKKFQGRTVVKRNSLIALPIKQKVNLEDPEFEALYDVYSDDQIEARYLLTSAFMNRLVKLAKKGYGNNITLSFEQGNVNIALSSNKNWFEIPFTKDATNINNYKAIIFDLLSLLKIIDDLKLEQKIGL